MRRARNEISRSAELSAAAADLLDQGLSDAEVAERMSQQFGRKISARTVGSFRRRDYAPIAEERLARQEAARRVQLVLDGVRGNFAEAAQDLLARLLYDLMRGGSAKPEELVRAGQVLARIRECEIAAERARIERERHEQAQRAALAAQDPKLSPAERAARIKEIFGLS